MHRRHQAFFDAEAFLEQDVDDRGQAVGRATGVGDDVVLGGVVLLVVDAHDDGDVLAFARRGDDHFLGAGGDVALRLFRFGEQAGRFDDVVDAELLPGQGGRAFLDGEALDLVAVDDERVVLGDVGGGLFAGDGAVEFALRRIVFEQIGEIVGGDEVVDGDDVECLAEQTLLDDGPEDQPPDAAETIDADTYCHLQISLEVIGSLLAPIRTNPGRTRSTYLILYC